MKLVIAEKPSVAQAIAKVLKATEKKDGYIQNNEYIISWCVGHLIELAEPDVYDDKYKKWDLKDIPIFPEQWLYTVSQSTKKQYKILKDLMDDKRVTGLVCATDAGREGELIFRYVYNQAKCKKPFQRLWISSMEDKSIKEGFENLKDSSLYDNLYDSALCRAKADWLVGMNETRHFTLLYRSKGVLNVGRVISPTLAMLVERENQIQGFTKEKYYNVHIRCGEFEATGERINDKQTADKLQASCHNQKAIVTSVEREEKKIAPPRLYDLTTLQREANRLFGYTAQNTLDHTQSLYEKKLVTYPRTDSQYLTEDMTGTAEQMIYIIAEKFAFAKTPNIFPNIDRITDSSKVTDHHAIIPTAQLENVKIDTLPEGELNILSLISMRLLSAVADQHIFEKVTARFECAGNIFTVKGKTTIQHGWKEIEQIYKASIKGKDKDDESDQDKPLPLLSENQEFDSVAASITEKFTSPPNHYTEDTLLSAMETAGNNEIDKSEPVEKKGIGTPATRASVIETLVKKCFINRDKKKLIPTQKGINLISVLPESLKTAKLTAEWENALAQIAKGALPAKKFMDGIEQMISEILKEYTSPDEAKKDLFREPQEVIGICPRCGSNVYEGKLNFYCDNKECLFTMWKNDNFFKWRKRELTKEIAVLLLRDGKTDFIKDFYYSEKTKKSYTVAVVLNDTGEKYVNYTMEFENSNGKGE